ncbi:MAG: DNA repair exonuclease [Chloroflexota bacterium]|nr:MAG: DNA repair exonuclease [Chloroflexota bacterium]
MSSVRIVLFADTHLGFDYPIKPRVERRRRGPDFFDNFRRVLDYARESKPDLIVHGGDLFFRARIPPPIVDLVYGDIFAFASEGIPMVIVPGNHERSILPSSLFLSHPGIFIFDQPRTFKFNFGDSNLFLSGFPCQRNSVRSEFPSLIARTGWKTIEGGGKLLCFHQTVEGAKVGPSGYTFKSGADVIRRSDLPVDALAVLSGHIHRNQILGDFAVGNKMSPVVIYPGSTERTSFAERDEQKGFYDIEFSPNSTGDLQVQKINFIQLYARPMEDLIIENTVQINTLNDFIRAHTADMNPDSIIRLRCEEGLDPAVKSQITSQLLRQVLPETMNYQYSGDFRQ